VQPAVEEEANGMYLATGDEEETRLCCGEGCSQKACLSYLAELLKDLERPVSTTLDECASEKGRDEL